MTDTRFRYDPSGVGRAKGRLSVWIEGKDAYGRHACDEGEKVTFTFSLPVTLGAVGGSLFFSTDEKKDFLTLPLFLEKTEKGCDFYSVLLDTEKEALEAGLYFCRAVFQSGVGPITAYGGNDLRFFVGDDGYTSAFQLTVCHFSHPAPAWIYGGGIYHVFVDRFFRAGKEPCREDAILNPDWEGGMPQFAPYPGAPLANNMFFGGDLPGVTAKLPYIASLGVNCIYLSPIFRAYSNHKYDTGNYREVDAMFGGLPALRELIAKAKERGIRVVLDGVFNHTGDDSLYFNRYGTYPSVGAYQAKDSPYADWYTFRHFPDDYEAWWNIPIMPRLNTASPSCRDYFLGEEGVIATYAAEGIGGMRLDVADELSDGFIRGIKARLCEADEENILYGEVWEDASNKIAYGRRCRYYQGDRLDGVMNYPLRTGLIDFFREGDTGALHYYFSEILPNMPKRIANAAMNLLGTHDTLRVLTALGGERPEGKSNAELSVLRMSKEERRKAKARLKAAFLALATLPGVPSIYYGDEAGMEGYADPFNRMPFPWGREDCELLAHYRAVAALRKNGVYREGECRLLSLRRDLLAFTREEGKDVLLTLCHNGEGEYRLHLPKGAEVCFGGEKEGGFLLLSGVEGAVVRLPRGCELSF